MKNIIGRLVVLLVVIQVLSSCHSGKSDKNANSRDAFSISFVEGFVVKPVVLNQSISVAGSIRAAEETVLTPDVAGRVVMINLPEGQFVKQGTLLVKLFDADMQASLKKLQTQLEIEEQTKKRQGELLKVSGISQLEYDQTTLQVNSIKDDIEVLKAQISKTEVRAPFDGVIGLRNISVGAQVTPALGLATIRQVNQLKLDFSIPEKYSADVTDGKKVHFQVEGLDSVFEARIMASEGGIEENTRNLKVRAIITSHSPVLKPGAFAKVELPLEVNPTALMIPTQAVIPAERDKKVIVSKNHKADFVTVVTGVRQASMIEIVDGLSPGDTIVTTGLLFLKPKAGIKFSKIQ